MCARRRYGANYLLEELDLKKIKAHPKIFVGYSDITTLLTHFTDATRLVAFHGPMVAKDWVHENGVNVATWQSAVSGTTEWDVPTGSTVNGLVDGEAEGILYGGCLSILVASLGTPYEIKTAGTILFLEDLAAKPFQIDRMLMQLKLAGHLEKVRGLVFGQMLDCVQTANQGYSLQEVITRIVGDLEGAGRLRDKVGPRHIEQHYAPVRSACETYGKGRTGRAEAIRIGGDAVSRPRRNSRYYYRLIDLHLRFVSGYAFRHTATGANASRL